MPSELIDKIYDIYKREKYQALNDIFSRYAKGDTEYLSLTESEAQNLLRLADIEMSKALLKYPHNEPDDPEYDPSHEEAYNNIMLGIYEKTYYYIQSEFK